MTAARGPVGVFSPKNHRKASLAPRCLIAVTAALLLAGDAKSPAAQTAQQQRPPTPPAITAPEDATVTQLRERANAGDAAAQVDLGSIYDNGRGVPQDYAQAVRWYAKAAEQANAEGQFNLGVMYTNGQGVARDYTQAVKWYRKAAEQGNAGGQFGLGVMYHNGQGVPQDYTQAIQ